MSEFPPRVETIHPYKRRKQAIEARMVELVETLLKKNEGEQND